ncbi:MAG: MFS transporter [Bacteroidota bacterium]
MPNKSLTLPLIVISQFACTSLWFACNGVLTDLLRVYALDESALGHLTSAVQFGFIIGTLVFALLTLADRFSPSRVFLLSALAGAMTNLGMIYPDHSLGSLVFVRFLTGFCLAGIYPVGMKIAADYHEKGLGKALGFLVGALVLGTAFPHFLKSIGGNLDWRNVVYTTSVIAILGGCLVGFLVPDGPFRTRSKGVDFRAFFSVFDKKSFRSAAGGYFGHMWELYAFWAFVPVWLEAFLQKNTIEADASLLAFLIIGLGSISCVIGGYFSEKNGSGKIALVSLAGSGLCVILSPLAFTLPFPLFLIFLLIWGMLVIADSPQFSTLVAQYAPADQKGTALTIVNSIGFAITILSMQLIGFLINHLTISWLFWVLLPGPLFGLWTARKFLKKK